MSSSLTGFRAACRRCTAWRIVPRLASRGSSRAGTPRRQQHYRCRHRASRRWPLRTCSVKVTCHRYVGGAKTYFIWSIIVYFSKVLELNLIYMFSFNQILLKYILPRQKSSESYFILSSFNIWYMSAVYWQMIVSKILLFMSSALLEKLIFPKVSNAILNLWIYIFIDISIIYWKLKLQDKVWSFVDASQLAHTCVVGSHESWGVNFYILFKFL